MGRARGGVHPVRTFNQWRRPAHYPTAALRKVRALATLDGDHWYVVRVGDLAADFARTGSVAETAVNQGYEWNAAAARLLAVGALADEDAVERALVRDLVTLYGLGMTVGNLGALVDLPNNDVSARLEAAGVARRQRRRVPMQPRAAELWERWLDLHARASAELTEIARLGEEGRALADVCALTGSSELRVRRAVALIAEAGRGGRLVEVFASR
jgi:site-specific recombinase XerC